MIVYDIVYRLNRDQYRTYSQLVGAKDIDTAKRKLSRYLGYKSMRNIEVLGYGILGDQACKTRCGLMRNVI